MNTLAHVCHRVVRNATKTKLRHFTTVQISSISYARKGLFASRAKKGLGLYATTPITNYIWHSVHRSTTPAGTFLKFDEKLLIPKAKGEVSTTNLILTEILDDMVEKSNNFLGYPVNQFVPPPDAISKALEIHLNNAGDPFIEGSNKTHTKKIEQAVLRFCAELWEDEPIIEENPHHKDNYCGYILNMGSTEGNLNALWSAREYFKKESNITPFVFFSEDTHYSLPKACDILSLDYSVIASDEFGRIDIDALKREVQIKVEPNTERPVIVNYNMGSTFKGAYDDCEKGIAAVNEIVGDKKKHWTHLDGALGGFIIPYLREGIHAKTIEKEKIGNQVIEPPMFGFNVLDIQSCSASFYKWFGAPYPIGVFMTQREFLRIPEGDDPQVVGAPDTTLGGGRNAFSALYMWWRLKLTDHNEQVESVRDCLDKAKYLERELKKVKDSEYKLDVKRSPYSMAVTFNTPKGNEKEGFSSELEQYSIPQADGRSHIYTMKHVTYELLDRCVDAIAKEIEF